MVISPSEKAVLLERLQKARETKAAKAAHASKTAAAAASKAGLASLGKGVLTKGALVGTIVARRAAWPAFVIGTAFGSAAWFGVYEMASGVAEKILPPSKTPEPGAHAAGLCVIPCVLGGSAWAGWRFSPPITLPPEQMLDVAGCGREFETEHPNPRT